MTFDNTQVKTREQIARLLDEHINKLEEAYNETESPEIWEAQRSSLNLDFADSIIRLSEAEALKLNEFTPSKVEEERVKDYLTFTEFTFIGQGNANYEGVLSADSIEIIARQIWQRD